MPGSSPAPVRGRFAPSPSGPLHFGSVVTALGSFLEARVQTGEWLVRIENIDREREVPGATDDILRTLERLGLEWDGPVVYQDQRRSAYRAALEALRDRELVYRCRCSRRLTGGGVYPGTCREQRIPSSEPGTWRLRVDESEITLIDAVQGKFRQTLATDCGDFVVWRADDWPAYHLAVVVDDAWQGVTQVVRGADLLESTPRQCWLQSCLGLPRPNYAHLPLALDPTGAKLSKTTHAHPVAGVPASRLLAQALAFLGFTVPPALMGAAPGELLPWALSHWQLGKVPPGARTPPAAPLAGGGAGLL